MGRVLVLVVGMVLCAVCDSLDKPKPHADSALEAVQVKLLQINHHRKDPEGASPSLRKRYAKAVFCMLRRQARRILSLHRLRTS